MSGIQAISGGMAAGAAAASFHALSANGGPASALGTSSAGQLAGAGDLGQITSANSSSQMSQQSLAVSGSVQQPTHVETLGALLLALLLSKADNEKEKQNSALLLAELALMGAMAQGGSQYSFSSQFASVSAVSEAYTGGGMAAAAGGSFNATA